MPNKGLMPLEFVNNWSYNCVISYSSSTSPYFNLKKSPTCGAICQVGEFSTLSNVWYVNSPLRTPDTLNGIHSSWTSWPF